MTHDESIERTIANAVASVEMEGFHVDEDCRNWCQMLLDGKITFQQYLENAKKKFGVAP